MKIYFISTSYLPHRVLSRSYYFGVIPEITFLTQFMDNIILFISYMEENDIIYTLIQGQINTKDVEIVGERNNWGPYGPITEALSVPLSFRLDKFIFSDEIYCKGKLIEEETRYYKFSKVGDPFIIQINDITGDTLTTSYVHSHFIEIISKKEFLLAAGVI